MTSFTSQYKGLNAQSTDNEEDDYPPEFTTLANELEKSKWSHIDDLDEFFTRVYQYHQNHGMPSLIFMEILNLFQIIFLACFSLFMIECVDYKTLFQNQKVINDKVNNTVVKKNTLQDVIFPVGQCVQKIDLKLWFALVVVMIFWLFRLIKAIYNIARYAEIRSFYHSALNIQTKELPNITWHEVQEKLLQMQKKHHLCIHKQELTELDIYNRILRFKNYEVAMVNQGLLPPKLDVPVLGQLLSKSILILGLVNLVLAPAIFVWQLLQFLYNYTELIKRDPGVLGSRRWSNYGRLYFRHFNELDHELEARLSRAYKPALLYLSSFLSKFLIVIAKFFVFTFGAVFAVLVILTVYDEDVLNVEHVLTIISITGAIAGIARSLIPDENFVYFMDQMMYQILAHVHYMPDSWKNHANSLVVRDEFVKLFQYKFVYLLEELLSPITTPFILIFWLRPRASKIVDFLRNFTVDVVGVGDVCSFAQMDTRRHGNPRWLSKTNTKKSFQARNGKTELSLVHFVHTNPNWKVPLESMAFIEQIKDTAIKEASVEENSLNPLLANSTTANSNNNQNVENSLNKSLYHLQSLVYNPNLPSNLAKSINPQQQFDVQVQQQQSFGQQPRGAVSRIEGPLFTNKQQTLLNIAQASTLQLSSQGMLPMPAPTVTTALENSLDMCFSALYMHELHRKYHHGDYIDLDNVKEENDEDEDNEGLFDMNQKRPLLNKRINYTKEGQEEELEEEDEEIENDDLNTTFTNLNENNLNIINKSNRYNNKPKLKLTHNTNKNNTSIEM